MLKIAVNIKPGSRVDSVEKVGDEYVVRTKARAVDGKANAAVVKLVAKHFGVSKTNVRIVQGAMYRKKQIAIEAEAV